MIADTSGRGSRRFPEIRVQFGSWHIQLAPGVQIAALSALIAAAAALCYLSVDRIGRNRLIATSEAAMFRAETANADLQDEVASLRDKLAVALRAGDQAEVRSTASPSEAASTTIIELTQGLDQSRRELQQVEAQRAAFAARLAKLETGRSELSAGHGPYKARLEEATKRLQQLSAERDKALGERDRLRARIAQLEQKHSQQEISPPRDLLGALRLAGLITTELARSEAEPPSSEAVITDAPPEAESNSSGIAGIGWRALSEFRRRLASTGLNVERLFPQFGSSRAEGGPFVPPPRGDQPIGISQDKLEAMRSLIKSLPLTVPLDYYQIESRFGPRRDPFNRRPSFHTGLDLSAPYMTPVYATAGGTVTYTGYGGQYGKVVEIDHGNGITTLYGHLHRFIVSVGQRVAEHTQIGFLGSTGRSSGPHVHYEILVNDEAQDPEKFIGLARAIPVADSERGGELP